jgi:chloramphenicol-sensitive protein RarD
LNQAAPTSSPTAFVIRPTWGTVCAISAQIIWGGFPYFYHLVKSVDSFQLVAHRCIWGFLTISIVLSYFWLAKSADKRPVREFLFAISSRRTLKLLALAALLSGINWVGFVWAATNGRALEASFGYYICPQIHVFLGVIILGERLSFQQWLAVTFAGLGVLYIAIFSTGVPWIALLMATSFGLYGLVKKKVPIGVIPNLTLETGMMFIPALLFLGFSGWHSGESLVQQSWWINGLVIFSGLLTIAPLALYGTAVRHIPLSTVGLLQFIGPTLQFVSAVLLLGEAFDLNRLVGFVLVWIGLFIFLWPNRRTF